MSNAVSWNLELAVHDGRLAAFKSLMVEMIESTRAEPGALAYEWFLSEDGTVCHLYERYSNDEAVMTHLGSFNSKFSERFLECVQPTAFNVYGNPGDEIRAILDNFGVAYLGSIGGFAR